VAGERSDHRPYLLAETAIDALDLGHA